MVAFSRQPVLKQRSTFRVLAKIFRNNQATSLPLQVHCRLSRVPTRHIYRPVFFWVKVSLRSKLPPATASPPGQKRSPATPDLAQ